MKRNKLSGLNEIEISRTGTGGGKRHTASHSRQPNRYDKLIAEELRAIEVIGNQNKPDGERIARALRALDQV